MSVSCKVCCVTPDYSSLPPLLTHPFSFFSSLRLSTSSTCTRTPRSESSVFLPRTRRLPLRAHRGRSPNLRARVHHHLPVLASGRATSVGHSDTRVARRAERVGRGRQGNRFSRSGCHGAPAPAHGPEMVHRPKRKATAAGHTCPRGKTDVMTLPSLRWGWVTSAVSRAGCTCILLRVT